MTTVNNGPELWNELLDKAPDGSIIMGGAVCDYGMGVAPKDIDIFCRYAPGVPEIDGWKYIPRNEEDERKRQEDYDIEGQNGRNPIGYVYDYEVPVDNTTYKIQLIGTHYANPIDHFQNFDHTLTLGVYSKDGLFTHRKFFESFYNKTVTCLNSRKAEKSLERAKRKALKYEPDWNWTYEGFEQRHNELNDIIF